MRMSSLSRVRRRAAFAFGVAAILLVGCQLLVPGDLPDFKCASADPSACPSGMVCDLNVGKCVTSEIVTPEASEEDAEVEASVKDVKTEADAPLTAVDLGGECTANGDCKSKICGTSTILTTAIIPGAQKPICTQPCCTSAECPTAFVCFGAGTGGNYCVPATRAQRAVGGTKTPGQTCTAHAECRSGLCDPLPSGRCLDTCCGASDCAAGSTCRVKGVAVPPPLRETWACAAPQAGSTKDPPTTCGDSTECRNDNCAGFPKKCRPSCCSSASCTAYGANAFCAYGTFLTTNADTKWCFGMGGTSPDPTPTGAALGATCNGDLDCASRLCDPESKKCVTACCRDIDCANGTVCRPSPAGAPLLRCVEPR